VSAYGRPEIAWNNVTAEFAGEFAPLLPQQVAAAIVDSAASSGRRQKRSGD
jgi:putative hydrolase of the HAD superfamily